MTTKPYLEEFLIPLLEIKSATDNFSEANCIGWGGFGRVYKGKLAEFRAINIVAIKRLDPRLGQGKIEFDKELETLCRCKHENIVTLVGYCTEDDEMIIIYEYFSNGSLDKYLRDAEKMASMTWPQRLRICVGITRGLNYLHNDVGPNDRIIHRDVKSSNILLGDKWEAKISDFGLSKLGPKGQPNTMIDTRAAGTLGYCDPYYHGTNILTKESDVYSLGVVLLEMLCGRLVFPKKRSYTCNDNSRSLVQLVWRYNDDLDKIMDPHIKDQMDPKSVATFKKIAMQCIEFDYRKRPSMALVLQKLEDALGSEIDKGGYGVVKRMLKSSKQIFVGLGVASKTIWGSGSTGKKLTSSPEKRKGRGDTWKELPFDVLIKKFSYKELARSTGDFAERNKIGEGYFSTVYKGSLQDTSTLVAIKKIQIRNSYGKVFKELETELRTISDLRHRNLMKLMGCFHGKKDVILVYEYMENGTLYSHLYGADSSMVLTWEVRLRIARDLASALLYLQEELPHCVLHRDIKPTNILLDANFSAKLGDFGMAKFYDHEKDSKTTSVVGTMGYLDPEYIATGKPTKKLDIYSFGVVALEIACGRKPLQYEASEGPDRLFIVDWVWEIYTKASLPQAVDPRLAGNFAYEEIKQLMMVGLWCTHHDSHFRPSMRQVIQVLNFEASVPHLPPRVFQPLFHRSYEIPTIDESIETQSFSGYCSNDYSFPR